MAAAGGDPVIEDVSGACAAPMARVRPSPQAAGAPSPCRRTAVPPARGPGLAPSVAGGDGPFHFLAGQREKHKELNGTVCIYSPYLNSIKTIQQGRRIPLKFAVEDPTAWEIMQVFHVAPAFRPHPCARALTTRPSALAADSVLLALSRCASGFSLRTV
jgi:hypothetical protein